MAKNKKASNDVIGLDVQLSKSEAFIEKHLKLILAILAVVVIVVSGIFIYRHYMSNQTAEKQSLPARLHSVWNSTSKL